MSIITEANILEEIRLPKPADSLWPTIDPLLHWIADICDTTFEDCFMFGGGTILAARWNHRKSTDIDLLGKPGSGIRDKLDNGYFEEFRRLCIECGVTNITMFPTTQTVTVVFPQGSLDLTEMDPLLKGEEEIYVW